MADATIANLPDGVTAALTDRLPVERSPFGAGTNYFVTPAYLKTLFSLSGTNTGDQTTIVGITGTKAQFNTACTDGDFLYVGDVTQYTDEAAQDAIGAMVDSTLVYVDATPLLQRAALTGDVTAAAGSNATTIAAGVVTLAKMATGTAGNVIAYDASGNPAAVATGSATQVLTSNGAGAAPTFQAAGAASIPKDFMVFRDFQFGGF